MISIVGRYLEHSRIYLFGADEEDAKVYIASADFMTRNTTKRVEVAAPIWDKAIKERIMAMFHLMLKDNVKARELGSDGNYSRVTDSDVKLNSQEYFCYELSARRKIRKSKRNVYHYFTYILPNLSHVFYISAVK